MTFGAGFGSFVAIFLATKNNFSKKLRYFEAKIVEKLKIMIFLVPESAVGFQIALGTSEFQWEHVLWLSVGLHQVQVDIGHGEGVIHRTLIQYL